MLTKVHIVKAIVFPVVTYGCESWTIKKAEHWRLMLLKCAAREDLRVPWTARRSNQSNIKEINPKYSLEGLMLKVKLQYFDHLMQITDSLEKTLMLGNIEGRSRRGWQRMRWLDGIINSMDIEFEQTSGDMKGRETWHATAHGVKKSQTWLSDWTTTNNILMCTDTFLYMLGVGK